jgi:hypothetical protein
MADASPSPGEIAYARRLATEGGEDWDMLSEDDKAVWLNVAGMQMWLSLQEGEAGHG